MSQRIEVNVSELSGPALTWSVANAQGTRVTIVPTELGPAIYDTELLEMEVDSGAEFKPSLERMMIQELIGAEAWDEEHPWRAEKSGDCVQYGDTPLEAVSRSYVEAIYGMTMGIPEELLASPRAEHDVSPANA